MMFKLQEIHLQVKKKNQKISPGFYYHPQTERNYSVLSRQYFLKKSFPVGPFSPNKRKNEFSAKIRLC